MRSTFLFSMAFTLALALSVTSCRESGCMDPIADNFDPFAELEGPCTYSGCTDPDALNYDFQATRDNGTCVYPDPAGNIMFWSSVQCCAIEVSVNDSVVGTINLYFNQGAPECRQQDGVVFIQRDTGTYAVSAQTITGDTLVWQDTIVLEQGVCLPFEFSL